MNHHNSEDSESPSARESAEIELGLPESGNSRRRQSLGGPEHERPAKRARDDGVRSRVSRACDRCKIRKTRCSGKFPCKSCVQMKMDCQFTAAYRRGRLPSIEASEEGSFVQMLDPTAGKPPADDLVGGGGASTASATQPLSRAHEPQAEITVNGAIGSAIPGHSLGLGDETRPGGGGAGSGGVGLGAELLNAESALSSRNSPEPTQTDQQGHFVGPSSGVAFLLRLQRKLQKQMPAGSSDASIFTFGDLPLPDTDPSFVILPPRNEAETMVRRYFDFATATHRFLHRPTVEAWLAELYETAGVMREAETARSRTALLFMVFAQSTSFPGRASALLSPSLSPEGDDSRADQRAPHAAASSARFFSAAEHQLSAEKGRIRLTSVQARLAQCFYLIAHSRLNHCWTLFGTTAHLVIALGIHRRTRVDSSSSAPVDWIDLECRKRTFWAAYNLDIYLSSALGRPRTFHDEQIDQDLPGCVDDSQLTRSLTSPPVPKHHSIMSGPAAHYRLSRILAGVLRDLYGIRPPSRGERLRLAEHYTRRLAEWRAQVSYLLDTDGDSSIFVRIVLRQRDLLKLAFWHAQILVHRPFLLESFASLTRGGTAAAGSGGGGGGGLSPGRAAAREVEVQENVRRCLNAAMGIAKLIHEIDTSEQLYSTMFLIPYFGFSAVVVLYVHAIQQRSSPPETYMAAFNAATLCQTHLSNMATQGSLTERYGVVLQELREELLKHNPYLSSSPHIGSHATVADSLSGGGGTTIKSSSSSGCGGNFSSSTSFHHRQPQQQPPPVPPAAVPLAITEQRDLMDMMRTTDGLGFGRTEPAGAAAAGDPKLQQLFESSTGVGQPPSHPPLMFADDSPGAGSGGSPITQMTGWGQFDSIVTGGTGRLDAFFSDSTLENWEVALGGRIGG